jgi:hypothetical protein
MAKNPILRLVVCSDPPVNQSAHKTIWACRKVKPVLYSHPDGQYVPAPRGGHASFPVIDRTYKLDRYKPGLAKGAVGDLWLLDLSYAQIYPFPAAMDFDPRQRVAFAAELIDSADEPVDPQAAMQALPIAHSMTRLSVPSDPIRSPVIVRTGIY